MIPTKKESKEQYVQSLCAMATIITVDTQLLNIQLHGGYFKQMNLSLSAHMRGSIN